MSNSKSKNKIKSDEFKICNNCNPKRYLKFNFTYCKEEGTPAQNDPHKLIERMQFLSSEFYNILLYKFQGNKKTFIEEVSIDKIDVKIPDKFRTENPIQTNEKISIFRIYPAGKPDDTANPRVIGMIRNTIFYIFYIDWKGKMYNHN